MGRHSHHGKIFRLCLSYLVILYRVDDISAFSKYRISSSKRNHISSAFPSVLFADKGNGSAESKHDCDVLVLGSGPAARAGTPFSFYDHACTL